MSEDFPSDADEGWTVEERDGVVSHTRVGKRPLITLIIPTRNEAENIETLLQRVTQATKGLTVEMLFVDDSSDHTPNMIRLLAKKVALPVRVLERTADRRNGLSGAIVEGMELARGEWICVMDADLQHPPEVIPQLLAQAQKTGAQLVVGSRKTDLIGPLGLAPRRAFIAQLLNLLARLIFPHQLKNVSDSLTGLFLVRRKAIDVTQLHPGGFKILLELLVRIPDVYVSEVHFDFGERMEGQSKADLNEGLQFLRHLVELRVTANPHFTRWLLLGISGLLGNIGLLVLLTEWFGIHHLLAAVLATECVTIWNFYWAEHWVFRERREGATRGRFRRFWLMNQLFLFCIRLPLIWLLVGWSHYVTANLLSIGLVSLIRYGMSDQWIWTRRLVVRPLSRFYYNIHGLIGISSPVRLSELDVFASTVPLTRADIYVRSARQATPRCLPGAVCYDEGLGRLGYGVAIMQGEAYSELVVSAMLERSPQVLYQTVIEPVLRWTLVRKGYALVHGACGVFGERGVLVTAPAGHDVAAGMLAAVRLHDGAFMGGNGVILGQNGRLLSFPTSLSLSPELVQIAELPSLFGFWQRGLLGLNTVLGRLGRLVNGRLLAQRLHHHRFPVATLGGYWQRWLPAPRIMVEALIPGLAVAREAAWSLLVLVLPHGDAEPLSAAQAVEQLLQNGATFYSLPPHPALMTQLGQWRGQDLAVQEREIVASALRSRMVQRLVTENGRWWDQGDVPPPTGLHPFWRTPLSPEF